MDTGRGVLEVVRGYSSSPSSAGIPAGPPGMGCGVRSVLLVLLPDKLHPSWLLSQELFSTEQEY